MPTRKANNKSLGNKLRWLLLCLPMLLAACKIVIEVPAGGGRVTTESGSYSCEAGQRCVIDVTTTNFDETFIAEPGNNQTFVEWQSGDSTFCGGNSGNCKLFTNTFGDNQALLDILASDREFYLRPSFATTSGTTVRGQLAINSLFETDNDINDPDAPYEENDDFGSEQRIFDRSFIVNGYVNRPGTGSPGRSFASGDITDTYEVLLLENDIVSVVAADFPTANLVLGIFNSARQLVFRGTTSTSGFVGVRVPEAGTFTVAILADTGASSYLLLKTQDQESSSSLDVSQQLYQNNSAHSQNSLANNDDVSVRLALSESSASIAFPAAELTEHEFLDTYTTTVNSMSPSLQALNTNSALLSFTNTGADLAKPQSIARGVLGVLVIANRNNAGLTGNFLIENARSNYVISGIPDDDYLVGFSTDVDNDGNLFEAGEIVGAYPDYTDQQFFSASGDTTGIDFVVSLALLPEGLE